MNKYNPNIQKRKSIRLKGYDYSQAGLYFITICVKNRKCLFGKIINTQMILNDAGEMIKKQWEALPERFKNIRLDEYILMPNHFHAILEIVDTNEINNVGATLVVAQNDVVTQNNDSNQNNDVQNNDNITQNDDENVISSIGQPQGIAPTANPQQIALAGKTVGDMVGAFQSITTVEYIRGVKKYNWQRFTGKLWQRNYWEHIIRNDNSYQNISEYIFNNPSKWDDDKFNPSNEKS